MSRNLGQKIALLLPLLALRLSADLSFLDAAGYERVLQANRGQVLLVTFWATWCEPCREELPRLREYARRHDLKLITISADQPESKRAAERLLRTYDLRGPAYRVGDPGLQQVINAVNPKWSGVLPALFVYDRKGALIYSFFGEVEWTKLNQVLRR